MILVTGAGGMLGRELVNSLGNRGHAVRGIQGRAEVDLLSPDGLEALPACESVVHLAALNGVDLAWSNPERVLTENVSSTLNLLGWCRRRGVKRLVFASSYVYGHPERLPVDESHPIQPTNAYAASKWLGEQLCREYARWDIEIVALRFFNLIGPGQRSGFLIPTIVEQLLSKDSVQLITGRPRRDYIDVTDAAEACILALTSGLDAPFHAINIGSGQGYAVSDIVERLMAISGKRLPVLYSEQHRPNEVLEVVADISRAKEVLGWRPQVDFDESLRRVWQARLEVGSCASAS